MIAHLINELTIIDPDSKGEVNLAVYKHENGGIFAIDSSYVEQVLEENENGNCYINDPLSNDGEVELIEPEKVTLNLGVITISEVESLLFKFADENGLLTSKDDIETFNEFIKDNL